jgi:hypothetical protein
VHVTSADLLIITVGDKELGIIVLTDDDDLTGGKQQNTVFATGGDIDNVGEIANLGLTAAIATPGYGTVIAPESDGMPTTGSDFDNPTKEWLIELTRGVVSPTLHGAVAEQCH